MRFAIVVALVWASLINFIVKVIGIDASTDAQLISVAIVFAGAMVHSMKYGE